MTKGEKTRMLKIAITGNIASGKSAVEKFLREKDFAVFDTDEITHKLHKDNTIKAIILSEFCDYDILEGSEISRAKLGKIVFGNETLRKKLENILHPIIKEEIGRFFRQQEEKGEKIAFMSVPLLFEAKFEDIFDKIILIYANDEIRLKRLINRNNLSLEQAENRLKIQISQDEKISLADYVIYNNKSLDDLNIEVEKMLKLL